MSMLATLLAQSETSGSPLGGLVLFLPLILLFYFLMIRPQRQRQRQHMDLMKSLGVGDEVETVGGIYGVVKRADDDIVWLEIAQGTQIKVSRGAVRRKIVETTESDQAES